tara:strand:+ start:309 stop:548 length:240 start_codon:yes stop_codon:yes gene_type:complete
LYDYPFDPSEWTPTRITIEELSNCLVEAPSLEGQSPVHGKTENDLTGQKTEAILLEISIIIKLTHARLRAYFVEQKEGI